jgi:hypothetical protein
MRLRHVALALILGAALGIGYFSNRVLSAHGASEAIAASANPSGAASRTPSPPRPIARQQRGLSKSATVENTPPLPVAGAPLRETYAELSARAQNGESAAAKRLFFDLQRCHARKTQMQMLDLYASPEQPTSAKSEQAKRILDKLDVSDALCAGIAGDQIEQRGEWLREAALDGDAEAMVCYAAMPNDFGPSFLSDAWFDWMQRWRDEAPALVERADAAGQADVVALLRDAYTEQIIFGERISIYGISHLTAPDPVRAYAYALLYERLKPANSTRSFAETNLRPNLTPQQVAQGQGIADAAWPRFAVHVGDPAAALPCLAGLRALQP